MRHRSRCGACCRGKDSSLFLSLWSALATSALVRLCARAVNHSRKNYERSDVYKIFFLCHNEALCKVSCTLLYSYCAPALRSSGLGSLKLSASSAARMASLVTATCTPRPALVKGLLAAAARAPHTSKTRRLARELVTHGLLEVAGKYARLGQSARGVVLKPHARCGDMRLSLENVTALGLKLRGSKLYPESLLWWQ